MIYETLEIEATEKTRIDVFLAKEIEGVSRSQIQKIIANNSCLVNNKVINKANYKLSEGDIITILPQEVEVTDVFPEAIPLDIVYQDESIAVVNKPQGMVVHPAPGHNSGTLVNALLYHLKDLSTIGGVKRPGIVHRLDKDTSGLLVVAKNDQAHQELSRQMQNRTTKKIYWAVTEGIIKEDNGLIDAPIARHPIDRQRMAVVTYGKFREARTYFKVLERYKNHTLVELKLETGRTHQIRVHLNYIGHPIVGDPLYGYKKQKFKTEGQILHAKILGINHPVTGQWMEWEIDLPPYFKNILKKVID
ncbi:ribosomal large subunit pseudouridine synthase D [Anaerobranca californiensis DSM 14826]|jgi:23S rRNA pseudouridine1911/1915/1917 synthase|uniref:Pseudouridine synthase n=1 Tax=Anaerobranca californiensis DSM 14826 TaxID=1120989 RepID=A0A1M6KS20_9FIRM|nr:RluA family pseudouridine synthase [Anaerobranca californiensis]SHJ61732.1 ribosomal large subunit pseudouridine synthase D [Anaerobranca californiensis DSM 14826]